MSGDATKTFKGSCHCKAVQYEVKLKLSDPPQANRCNCTICVKTGYTGIMIEPEDFVLKSHGSLEELATYSARSDSIKRRFCNKCCVSIVVHGSYQLPDRLFKFFSVNANSFDQPQEGLDLSTFKINYMDGLNENWAAGPKDTPYPGGFV